MPVLMPKCLLAGLYLRGSRTPAFCGGGAGLRSRRSRQRAVSRPTSRRLSSPRMARHSRNVKTRSVLFTRPEGSRSAAIPVFALILLTGDRGFESGSLQRRVRCEPDFLSRVDHAGEVLDVAIGPHLSPGLRRARAGRRVADPGAGLSAPARAPLRAARNLRAGPADPRGADPRPARDDSLRQLPSA